MSHETSGVRHSLQLADYLIQCGDRARAAEIYLRLAAAYAERRRTPEAAAICYRVLHVDASQFIDVAVAGTLRHLGRSAAPICAQAADLHRQGGRHGDAVRLLALAAELDPSDALAPVRVAELLFDQHDYRGAVAALADAGARLLRDGNNADYLALAEQILAIDPQHAATLRELARTHVRIGEPHRAVDLLARLMKVLPEDPGGYEILAQAFATIGRTPKALSILTRLVHDRRRAGDEPSAQQMLDRAQWWSVDEGFRGGVVALREPSRLREAPQGPAREATVMLSIADITIEEERDLEGTLVLALDDLAFIEASRHRAKRPASPIAGRIAKRVGEAQRARGKTPPPPPPAKKRAPLPPVPRARPASSGATIVLDLSDLLEDEMATVLERQPIRDSELRRLAELAVDEDSGARPAEEDEAPTAVRKNPISVRARKPTALPSPPKRAPKAPTMPIRTLDRARPADRLPPSGRPTPPPSRPTPSPTRGRKG